MPGFNRQGPMNQGAMTGRGRGVCVNGPPTGTTAFEGTRSTCPGFGLRRGRGQGAGWGSCYPNNRMADQASMTAQRSMADQAPMATERDDAMEELKLRSEALESELNAIKQKLAIFSGQQFR